MSKRKIGIVVDSTASTNFKQTMFKDASIVPLTILVDGKEYVDGTLSNEKLLGFIDQKKTVKTSQPNPNLFVQAFEEQFTLGYEYVICLTISKGLSGTINSANLAKNILANDKVIVIDSGTVGPGVEYLLECIDRAINEDKSIDEIITMINQEIPHIAFLFSVEELSALVAGGRLSKLQAIVGNLLKIKPILRFKEGVLTVLKKVRGVQGILTYVSTYVNENMSKVHDAYVKMTYVDLISKSKDLEIEIYNKTPELTITQHGPISAVVATHLGYSGVGVLMIEKA